MIVGARPGVKDMPTIQRKDNVSEGRERGRNPYSERLEYVRREIAKIDDMRNFWRALGYGEMDPDDPEYISYESARRYHRDRTPPVDYLVRVSRRFPAATIEFLTTGELEREEGELPPPRDDQLIPWLEDHAEAMNKAVAREFPLAAEIKSVRKMVMSLADVLNPLLQLPDEDPDAMWSRFWRHRVAAAESAARIFRTVLEEARVDVDNLYMGQLEQFGELMALALQAVRPNRMFGHRVRDVLALRSTSDSSNE